MPTLQDILENDLGLGSVESSQEKVASQSPPDQELDKDIEKLAMEVGLVSDENEGETDSTSQEQPTTGQSKEANMSLEGIYSDLFPGDADIVGTQEKVAEESKEAEDREFRIGQAAYDRFGEYVDRHIDKIAEELTGDATISVEEDEYPDQAMATNEPADAEEPIDTTPQITDIVTPQKGESVSGAEKAEEHKDGEIHQELKQAAVRKHMLMTELETE